MNNQHSLEELTKQVATLQEENRQITQSLQTLKKKSAQSKDLVESAPDAIFVGSPDGNIIYANISATTLTRYSKLELLSMNLGQLFTKKEQQRSPLQYEQLNQGKTVKTERMLNRKDGTVVPIEMNSKVSPDGTYQSFFRDISERKEADNALRTSEEKFSRAFKFSPDAIAINRLTDGLYLEVNQGFTNALGWTTEEAVGRTTAPGDLDIWASNEDREKLMAGIKESGQVVGLEARFKHRNGQILIGLISAKIIEINGAPCLLSVTRDITERSRTMEKQKKLELQMLQVQKLESLGVLAGGIAHDFNNILMAVIGHSELAQRRLPTESPAMENLRQINLAASRAADLANQMLAYSGKGKFVVEALNLSQIITEMEHILSVSVSKKALVRYDLADDLLSVEADATQLQQVIMNLVINASDAIGDKSGTIAVSTGMMDCDHAYLQESWLQDSPLPGRYVFVEVADTGCGIAPEKINRIFEPFFSTKFTGRGLGMAAVLGIVRGHNGAIKIYTELNQGSTFKVLIPASTLPIIEQAPRVETAPLQESGFVLLVDDEETVRNIGVEMLSEFGFKTLIAADGKEALKIFKQQHKQIRFVLMDLTMPRMNGEEAFREFRRVDPAVKVIICSGYNEQEVSQKFVGKGLAGFLKKPYLFSDLQEKIQKLLNN